MKRRITNWRLYGSGSGGICFLKMLVPKKAILVGDPKQLPRLFCEEENDLMEEIGAKEVEEYKYIDVLL